jgi:malate dehydrogenase (oxaloacetate-decarboxylating)(NADP+)
MLSYSNFGSSNSPEARLVAHARNIVKQKEPSLIIDGEMQANVAFNKEILKDNYPFSELVKNDVNVLIFPNLAAGNVAYNLLQEVGGYEAIGPILLGIRKPVHILQLGSQIRSIYNMVLIAVIDAQTKCEQQNESEEVSSGRRWRKSKKLNAEK